MHVSSVQLRSLQRKCLFRILVPEVLDLIHRLLFKYYFALALNKRKRDNNAYKNQSYFIVQHVLRSGSSTTFQVLLQTCVEYEKTKQQSLSKLFCCIAFS